MPERLYEREGFTRSSEKYSSFFVYTVSKTISKTRGTEVLSLTYCIAFFSRLIGYEFVGLAKPKSGALI